MAGKRGGGRGKSKSQATPAPKTSKSAKKKRKQQAKTPAKPNHDLIKAAVTTLKNDEYGPQIREAGFNWSETLIQEIKDHHCS